MSKKNSSAPPARRFNLSEDWLATIVGLLIVLIIGSGLIGPGPQSVKLSADAGSTKSVEARAVDGWIVSATLAGESAPLAGKLTDLKDGKIYVYTCRDGQITGQADAAPPDGTAAPADDRALLVLVNECDDKAALAYKTENAIPWPVFELFK